jgi:hypothetical protein
LSEIKMPDLGGEARARRATQMLTIGAIKKANENEMPPVIAKSRDVAPGNVL